MASLGDDVDAILDVRVPKPKSAHAELAEDTVLVALFTTTKVSPPPSGECAKRNQSSRTSESEKSWARKK